MSEFSEGYMVGQGNHNAYGGYGGWDNGWNNGWWIILLLLCGWGNRGWGNNGEGQNVGYEVGKLATTNDVASGFSTSTIMSTQRETQLAQQQGFSDVQQTLCQGFSGINATVNAVGNNLSQGICNLGYNVQNGMNGISRQISDCCCGVERAIDGVNYNMARNTCDIIQSGKDNTQRIIDYLTCKENQNLRDENFALRLQSSQAAQNAYLVDQIRPTARPAYVTCSPFDSVYGFNRSGCGCCG